MFLFIYLYICVSVSVYMWAPMCGFKNIYMKKIIDLSSPARGPERPRSPSCWDVCSSLPSHSYHPQLPSYSLPLRTRNFQSLAKGETETAEAMRNYRKTHKDKGQGRGRWQKGSETNTKIFISSLFLHGLHFFQCGSGPLSYLTHLLPHPHLRVLRGTQSRAMGLLPI